MGRGSNPFSIIRNKKFYGTIYAPLSDLSLNFDEDKFGMVIARR